MSNGFLSIAATPAVRAVQAANGVKRIWSDSEGDRAIDHFGPAEVDFIAKRDSFYMATVSENGWPYVQHRGGPPGFLKILDEQTLAFADFRGNRQYISVGNLTGNDRASLILMDYAGRRRLKLYVRVEIKDLNTDSDLATILAMPGYKGRPERALVLHLEALDWNCPQHITPRYSEQELKLILGSTWDRIAEPPTK